MNEKTFRVLEFDKILSRLSTYASSQLGKELALTLRPALTSPAIKEAQAETTEACRLTQSGERIPLGGIHDLRAALKKAGLGGVLSPEELAAVGETCRAARLFREFFRAEQGETAPTLAALAAGLTVFPTLEAEIERAIEPEGRVKDNATPQLYRLRSQIRTFQNRVRDKLEAIVHGSETRKYLQESLVTLRNGRYVIPVKQEYRQVLPGIVHDQSASGATLFIEPMAIVEINNQLRQVEAEEEKEVARILAALSVLVGAEAAPALVNLEILARLDLAFAKARYSLALGGTEPVINDQAYLRLLAARHPLLEGDVVPIDLELGRSFQTLVITGPNTGGKTVSLKTAGLLTLMAQSGLHIPAASGSEVGVFTGIYCDIGDEQSIEQSLSTFSSHMTNIISILKEVQSGASLVLLDELGAGTDPAEGATLAIALLEEFHRRGVRTIATTHYGDLKVFAYNTQGVQNASVEFDPQTLAPTYRLLIGLPGRSNAFAVASRLGLDPAIIERARALLSPGERRVEDLIGEIMKERQMLEEERRDASVLRLRVQREEQELKAELAQLKAKRNELLKEAREEARALVRETRREMENLLRSLQEAADGSARIKLANQARAAMEEQLEALTEPLLPGAGEYQGELEVGMKVKLAGFGQEGVILDLNPENALVQAGAVRLWVERGKLTPLVEEKKQPAAPGTIKMGALAQQKAKTISPELDLRGMTVEEALQVTDKYLDEAILAGLPWVRLIHGKGTGALRAAIKDYVKKHPRVRKYRWGETNEGGMGVTVVELER
ncbi:MAG TPA: endonuclease MutS2 [Firmicutes bacterium]|nr:endonuclease MutS2 [Bacillota bacterium]